VSLDFNLVSIRICYFNFVTTSYLHLTLISWHSNRDWWKCSIWIIM